MANLLAAITDAYHNPKKEKKKRETFRFDLSQRRAKLEALTLLTMLYFSHFDRALKQCYLPGVSTVFLYLSLPLVFCHVILLVF